MKKVFVLTAAAALLAATSIASAQNAGGPATPEASPSNINKGDSRAGAMPQSGSESSKAATNGKMMNKQHAKRKSGMTTGQGNNGDAMTDTKAPPNKQ